MNTPQQSRIFISYSHRGRGPEWKAALLRALHVFEQQHLLDVWQDGKIRVSSSWEDAIEQAMDQARLAVVLLTREALQSDFILSKEFPRLRYRQRDDGLPVYPVICEDCNWRAHDWLRATQAPNGSNPLCDLKSEAQDRVFRKLATDIAEQLSRVALTDLLKSGQPPPSDHIYLDKFPLTRGAGLHHEKLIGREQELALLDLAFAQPHTVIASLVAWGGVGKTMLVQHWLQRLEREGWLGARRVYAWSFYSQGTKEDRQAPENLFLGHALAWFGVDCEPTLSPIDKGRLLADAVAREPTLLILDGIEPLQFPPGTMGGRLRAPGVQSLLKRLARNASDAKHCGVCLVTTRVGLTDLADFERRPDAAWGSVLRVDLGNLTEETGAALLHHAGANRAGAAEIEPDDKDLLAATREVDGHALTLNLLGRFLARAHGGDIRRRELVKFEEADRVVQGGTTFKMLAAFESWFAKSGEFGARQIAVLRILGLFDRPVDAGCVGALRKLPVIAGLTDPLFMTRPDASTGHATVQPLVDEDWNTSTSFLSDFGLLDVQGSADNIDRLLDCHPLIREYFAIQVSAKEVKAWRGAHQRLYEHLTSSTDFQPDTLSGLEPLYQSILHGCEAGLQSEALLLLRKRIQRGDLYFTSYKLGATENDLQAFASFFTDFPNPASLPAVCSAQDKTFILRQVGYSLRARGSLEYAEACYKEAVKFAASDRPPDWNEAALASQLLGETLLLHGNVDESCEAMENAVRLTEANPSDGYRLRINLTFLGTSLMQAGDKPGSRRAFEKAESILQTQPGQPQFLSLGNLFRLGEWLVSEDELDKAREMLLQAEESERQDRHRSLLSDGLRQLLLGVIAGRRTDGDRTPIAANHCHDAYKLFARASRDDFRAKALIEWTGCLTGQSKRMEEALRLLDEAWDIAERGPMRLHMADIHLSRARLFFREQHYPWKSPQDDLAAAEKLINDCGYHRRDEELADAKRTIFGIET